MLDSSTFPRPFGKYVLLQKLAAGGMAEVYLARQSGPAGFEKECVIKRILPSLSEDEQFVHMFLDEARIAARLSHPNIVQIYDLGKIGDHDYFLAMEHVHGVDLQHILEAERGHDGRMPLPIALRLVTNVAEGLEHAHRATGPDGRPLGIVHRDVSPANVIVSIDGVAKILDFGIAKAIARRGHTEVGVIKGKIGYMSPEQVQGEPLDARSDIFSLGVILYELTVGRRPFEGESPAELSLQILHDEPHLPEMVVEGYPEALSSIVRRALAKRREDRYSSARELARAIEEFLVTRAIACTAHDVERYLTELFPNLRRVTTAIPESTEPTLRQPLPRASERHFIDNGPAGPVTGEISSADMQSWKEERGRLGSGGGGRGTMVVAGLVIAVFVGFWLLRDHFLRKGEAELPAAPAATTAPAAAAPTAPATNPAANLPAPSTPAAGVAPEPGSGADNKTGGSAAMPREGSEHAVPEAAKPPSHPAEAAAPAAAKLKRVPPHRPHLTPAQRDGARPLPRLPTPPPPDDQL